MTEDHPGHADEPEQVGILANIKDQLSYFIPFMLSRWPEPDLVASREFVLETRENDLTSCNPTWDIANINLLTN